MRRHIEAVGEQCHRSGPVAGDDLADHHPRGQQHHPERPPGIVVMQAPRNTCSCAGASISESVAISDPVSNSGVSPPEALPRPARSPSLSPVPRHAQRVISDDLVEQPRSPRRALRPRAARSRRSSRHPASLARLRSPARRSGEPTRAAQDCHGKNEPFQYPPIGIWARGKAQPASGGNTPTVLAGSRAGCSVSASRQHQRDFTSASVSVPRRITVS